MINGVVWCGIVSWVQRIHGVMFLWIAVYSVLMLFMVVIMLGLGNLSHHDSTL